MALGPADQVFQRHPHLIKGQGGRIRGPDAHLAVQLVRGKSLGALLHHQKTVLLEPAFLLGVGAAHDQNIVGHGAVADELLAAVDHIAVALAHRAGGLGEDVAARVGLGDGRGQDDLAAGHPGQPALLLFLGPEALDNLGAKGGQQDAAHPGVCPPELLHDQGVLQNAQAQTAVLLLDEDAHETQFAGLLPDLPGIALFLVTLAGHLGELGLGELVCRLDDLFLLLAQGKIHPYPPSTFQHHQNYANRDSIPIVQQP